jgi:hypothetical protein
VRPIKPIRYNATGPTVSNLHKGLLFLIMHEPGISDDNRRTLAARLAPELRTQTYGQATLDIVKLWQGQLNNRPDVPKELLPITEKGELDQGHRQCSELASWKTRRTS